MQIASGQLAMKLDNADVEFYSELDELDEPFDVVMTDEALYAYAEIPSKRVYARIGNLIDFLAEHPYFGEEYDPYYQAAFPPIDCRVCGRNGNCGRRVFFCAHYGVYYHVDVEQRNISILAIEDHRKNPLSRFKLLK